MAKEERVGNQLRTTTYSTIREFISEQREIEMAAVAKKHEKWTKECEDRITNLRKLLEQTQLQAQARYQADPFSKQKWVNVPGLAMIRNDKGLGGRWKLGYSVNHKGEVQFFHRKVPDAIKLSS